MIDWSTALRYAATVVRDTACEERYAPVLAEARPFRNKEFPLSVLPVVVRHAPAAAATGDAAAYVALLNTVVRRYLEDEDLRRWYGLGPLAERLIRADHSLAGEVVVCRLDGYLERGSERLLVLENNADAPAGTLFTARINRLVRDCLERAGVTPERPSELTYADEEALPEALRACVHRRGLGELAHVAILQPEGAANRESGEAVAALRRLGVDAFLADPRSLEVSRERVSFGGRPATVCWNKVNTASWRTLVETDADLVERWARAVDCPWFVNVNPFGARYVAENKLSLAVLHEPRFAHLFTAAERDLARRLLPWAARLTKDAATPDGRSLFDDVLERPATYVIKAPYDIRGDAVSIGVALTQSEWAAAVTDALAEGHLVQRHVAPTAYPTIRAGDPAVVAMPISLDTYVLNGRVHGFGSKASLNAKVNVFQGGQKLAVHVVHTPAAGAR